MVVAVISDTHLPRGKRRLPDSCVASLRAADVILHAGDFTSAAVVDDIRSLGRLVAVHGNVDSEEVRRALPKARAVELAGVKVGMVHDAGPAAGRLERMRALFPDADAVVFGHSHIPLHDERDGFQIFNPGSPTDKRRQRRFTMGIGEIEDGRIRFRLVELD